MHRPPASSSHLNATYRITSIAALIGALFSPVAQAASFDIASGVTETALQTLNDNETGVIRAGGTLQVVDVNLIDAPGANVSITNNGLVSSVWGGNPVIWSSGSDATINNNGTLLINNGGSSGILSEGANARISNTGTLTALQGGSWGINSSGDNASISNSGTLTMESGGSSGILSGGANASISNSGAILTEQSSSRGILSAGDHATIRNTGTLLTNGSGSEGIESNGDYATIINSGTVSTTAGGSRGILSVGTNALIVSSGTVSTSSGGALGIVSTGANSTIENSGRITTLGMDAWGINSTNDGAIIRNQGTISTAGTGATGIMALAQVVSIANSGLITTAGNVAYGIYSIGDFIANSGSITTAGNGAYGIYSSGNFIANSGTIATTGIGSYGIFSNASDAEVNNSGTIATTGMGAHGIFSGGPDAIINHSGSISVTGLGATGISAIGAGAVINLSGLVSATGVGTQAIFAPGQTLNLQPGAAVVGEILMLGGHVNVALNGGGPSSTMTITIPGSIAQSGKGLSFVSGNTINIVDTTGLSASQASLGAASSSIFQAVNQQLNQSAPSLKPIKVAATELTSGMLHQDQGPTAWGHAFGAQNKRDGNGAALGYTDNGYGLIGGYEQTLDDHRVGFFGGLSRANLKTETASLSTDNDSVFLGAYGQYVSGDWSVNGALALGYVSADGERLVVDNLYGYETADSSYHSTYLSPSLAVTRVFDMGAGISLRPSAQLNYTYGRVGGYSENGTTRSNLAVGSHDASVLNTRLQVAARQEFADHQGEFEVRVGATHSSYGKDKVKINLQGGAATRYGITGTSSLTGGYVGAGGRLTLKNQLSLVGDVEYTQGSGDNHAAVGYLGLEYQY